MDTGRRRRWSEDEKLKIVLESLQAPRQVAATARRYGVSRSLLLRWRRSFRPEPKEAADQQTGFVPAMVVPESRATPGPVGPACQSAFKFDPVSAFNFDPLVRRVLAVALAPSELVGVAEPARARVGT